MNLAYLCPLFFCIFHFECLFFSIFIFLLLCTLFLIWLRTVCIICALNAIAQFLFIIHCRWFHFTIYMHLYILLQKQFMIQLREAFKNLFKEINFCLVLQKKSTRKKFTDLGGMPPPPLRTDSVKRFLKASHSTHLLSVANLFLQQKRILSKVALSKQIIMLSQAADEKQKNP